MKSPIFIFGQKLSRQFRDKVVIICDKLGIEVNWLIACMAFETGGTFSPSVQNKLSKATGLIQFMGSTAKGLGTTLEALKAMTAVEQLDYVYKYFLPYKGKINSLEDCYMAILYPVAIGKPLDFVLFSKEDPKYPKRYLQNKGLDLNRDGHITKSEAAAKVWQQFEKGMLPQYFLVTSEYVVETGKFAKENTKGIV